MSHSPSLSHPVLLPEDLAPAAVSAPSARYTRVRDGDPERMGGTQVRYANFDDFIETFKAEAADPHAVGAADVLDIINPLQHLPLISTLYRDWTGDHIKPGSRILGGAVFGGGVGLASSSVNAAIEAQTGQDVTGNMALAFAGKPAFTHNNPPATDSSPNQVPPIHISWNDPPPETTGRSLRQAASTYARVQMANPSLPPGSRGAEDAADLAFAVTDQVGAKPYDRVRMTDPERMAGSFVRYV